MPSSISASGATTILAAPTAPSNIIPIRPPVSNYQASADGVVVFKTAGQRVAKIIRIDGTIASAERASHYLKAGEQTVSDFPSMMTTLSQLEQQPTLHIVRGALIGPQKFRNDVRRLLHARLHELDGAATIRDVPRSWLFIDIDGVSAPNDLDRTDLRACDQIAMAVLPTEFHGREHIVAASGSHGIKPGLRLRLVFRLDRAIDGAEAKAWLGNVVGLDCSIFTASQPIYTAAPRREDGGSDHLPRRILHIVGTTGQLVPVPIICVPVIDKLPPDPSLDLGTLAEGTLRDLVSWVDQIPNARHFARRGTWLAFAHALQSMFEARLDVGKLLWLRFCDRWNDPEGKGNQPEVAEAAWDSLIGEDHRADFLSLANWAEQSGIVAPESVAALIAERRRERGIRSAQVDFTADLGPPPVASAPSDSADNDYEDVDVVRGELTMPRGFELAPIGLIYQNKGAVVRLTGPFSVLGRTRTASSDGWGLLIGFRDPDGREKSVVVPRMMAHRSGKEVTCLLAGAGLDCSTGSVAYGLIERFFARTFTTARRLLVDQPGWHRVEDGHAFVIPGGDAYGTGGETIVLNGSSPAAGESFSSAGTLTDWQSQVAGHAVGNSRLALFTAAAFAGPLLQITNAPSGGIHLVGQSQTGKSTAAAMAASVWGPQRDQIRSWRATDNGLEGAAAETSDSLLILDEIGQAPARSLEEVAYLLANGSGKARMARDGSARARKMWRSSVLSTGEVSLADRAAKVGFAVEAGVEVRLVNVPADPGKGFGVFDHRAGFGAPGDLADHLRAATARCYGTASRAFLQRLTAELETDQEGFKARVVALRDVFLTASMPPDSGGQVRTVAGRFGLIATAGELATDWGILPWPAGEATRAAKVCLDAWLAGRGSVGALEDETIIDRLRDFIGKHGDARFARLIPDGAAWKELDGGRIYNRAGYVRTNDAEMEYLFLSAGWREALAGLNSKRAVDVLSERALLLKPETGRDATVKVRIGSLRPRFYVVKGAILGKDDDDEAAVL